MRRTYSFLVPITFIIFSCADKGVEPKTPPLPAAPKTEVSFSQDVLTIFRNYGCTGCHGGTNGLDVTTVRGLKNGGFHGSAVVPLNADSSIVIQKISPTPPFGSRMPQGGPFVKHTDVEAIKEWINLGAKDN